jgi:hypothetical protein
MSSRAHSTNRSTGLGRRRDEPLGIETFRIGPVRQVQIRAGRIPPHRLLRHPRRPLKVVPVLLLGLPPSLPLPAASDSTHPHPVHTLCMPHPVHPLLQCHPVSQTPIYDQLRGERINADVPAPKVGPETNRPRRTRLYAPDARGAAEMSTRPPGPGTKP